MKSPLDARQRIRAVLFDLDGTLYRQGRMRTLMAMELLTLAGHAAPVVPAVLERAGRVPEGAGGLAASRAAPMSRRAQLEWRRSAAV